MSIELEGFSKKDHRQLGAFFAKELLYDYLLDQVDEQRRAGIEAELKTNPDLQLQLDQLKNSIQFCEELVAQVKIKPEAIDKMKNSATFVESFLKRIHFQHWPKGIKMSLESLGLAIIIMAIGWILPWNKLSSLRFGTSSEIILAEINHQYAPKDTDAESTSKTESEIAFPDEGISSATTTTSTLAVVAQISIPVVSLPKVTMTTTTTMAVAANKKAKTNVQSGTGADTHSTTTLPSVTTSAATGATATAPAAPATAGGESKRQGYLFRGSVKISNVAAISPKLVEKLEAMGGRKAGDVPLGWQKGSGSYFHFTVPELKYDEVIKLFGEYGKVQIQREKHDRVMPEGIIRIIINVDEAKP